MSDPSTPLMQQYHAIKSRYPHALLLFRLGDFYELFYEDAMLASRELQITLTSRNREKGQPIPMCGVPYHAADGYVARLIRAGFKIAICDQMEQPGPGKKIVRREVVRVITPGTATDVAVLDARENNFLAAVAKHPSGSPVGLAYVDLSTGEFQATEFSGPRADESRLEDWVFQYDYAERILREQFGVAELTGFGLDAHPQAIAAAGAIVHYLRENATHRSDPGNGGNGNAASALEALGHLDRVRYYQQHDALVLDPVSVRNLELVNPIFTEEATRSGPTTLLAALDVTVTGFAARTPRPAQILSASSGAEKFRDAATRRRQRFPPPSSRRNRRTRRRPRTS